MNDKNQFDINIEKYIEKNNIDPFILLISEKSIKAISNLIESIEQIDIEQFKYQTIYKKIYFADVNGGFKQEEVPFYVLKNDKGLCINECSIEIENENIEIFIHEKNYFKQLENIIKDKLFDDFLEQYPLDKEKIFNRSQVMFINKLIKLQKQISNSKEESQFINVSINSKEMNDLIEMCKLAHDEFLDNNYNTLIKKTLKSKR